MFRPETLRAGIRWFLALLALAAAVTPAGASAWSYGCKGVLPVFNDSETITFNRMSLLLLPKSYIKGTLRDLFVHDAVDDVLEVAKAVDINSGLAPSMAFTSLEHPDQKLTLTEKSSKTLSDVRERDRQPAALCADDHLQQGLSLRQRLRFRWPVRRQDGLHEL